MNFQIPSTLKVEDEELHRDLERVTKAGGRSAEAAKVVAKLMHPHFVSALGRHLGPERTFRRGVV